MGQITRKSHIAQGSNYGGTVTHTAWEFDERTPRVSADGLLQGAVFQLGKGRVAVFGEAAMFTAQSFERNGRAIRVGFADPEAGQNAQFVRNLMRWLSE